MKKFLKTGTFIYTVLFGVCLFILLQSPIAPYAKSVIGVDSGIYIYSARQILDGQLMYKDIVDNKGPFLYLINLIALLIFNRHFIGIWIFELVSLFSASIIMYKTARFFAGKVSSLSAVVAGMLFLVICIGRGNLTEEWALPYISLAMYIFTDYLKNNKPLTVFRLFVLSLTFVLTFMIRANLVAIWAGFGIVLLIKWIVEKRYRELIRSLSFILLFAALSILPFLLRFYSKGILTDAVYWVFTFNMFDYNSGSPESLSAILKTFLNISYIGIIIPFLIAIYMFFRDRSLIHGGVLSALIFTLLSCSLGHSFWHYYTIFVPLLVIPYSYLFSIIKENISKRIYIFIFTLFIAFYSVFIGRQLWLIYDNYMRKNDNALKMEKLTEIITRNTKPTDKILVKGQQTQVYLYSNRTSATRFPYTQERSSIVKERYVKEAAEALPKLIIQYDNENRFDSFSLDSLLNNRYQLIETVKNTEIWKLNE